MTRNTIVKNKNNVNKIIFVILSFLIAGLLVFNFIRISYAYFTDERTSNPSVITTGNVAIAYGLYNADGIEVSSPLYMDDNQLVPGEEIPFTFRVQNQGTLDCYLRIKLDFLIRSNGGWIVEPLNLANSYITIASNDANASFRVSSDGYLYYKPNNGVLAPRENANSFVEIPVKIVISGSFPINNPAYQNKNFGLQFGIQAMQTANITQSTANGWTTKDNNGDDVYINWDGSLSE